MGPKILVWFLRKFGAMSNTDIQFNKNEDLNKQEWDLVKARLDKIAQGGGAKAAAKQKEKGKLLARERINFLWIRIVHGLK